MERNSDASSTGRNFRAMFAMHDETTERESDFCTFDNFQEALSTLSEVLYLDYLFCITRHCRGTQRHTRENLEIPETTGYHIYICWNFLNVRVNISCTFEINCSIAL